METIKDILMRRDGMTAAQADILIADAARDLNDRLDGKGGDPFQICADWFSLEEDWSLELAHIAMNL